MTRPTESSADVYDLESIKLPYLSGKSLRLMVAAMEGPSRSLLTPNLLRSSGITAFRQLEFDEEPTFHPITYTGTLTTEAAQMPETELPAAPAGAGSGFHFPSVYDYARAYREGRTDPVAVAERVLDAIAASDAADPPLRAMIAVDREDVLRQARDTAERIRRGEARSVLDGVPVAVKDELDMIPYPTKVGTTFLGTSPATQDATAVARVRAAGALLIGKANMHEIGIGVTGFNPHYGTPRNPYDSAHYTGGSSSGPATAVAAGLCPVAIGADGGGSIRVPAAFCGVVGLKATHGRMSEFGAAPLDWSVAHVGPLAATATDAALAYGLMAGPDPQDPLSRHQPPPTLAGWDDLDLNGLTLGIFWPWFRHASEEVVAACESLLAGFQERGAQVREIALPDLEAGRGAHVITIASEMNAALESHYQAHHKEYGLDVRLNLALSRAFTARDYIRAQQARTRLIRNFETALANVDLIITPSTGIVAPAIPPAALKDGDSDLTTLTEIMRFATPANMTGLPAISFPAGYTDAGLPIGMQAMGRAWEEPTLLRLALVAEQMVERRRPRVWFDLLA
jgi:Asp-tRNA(Asn)/Glu-tRNA(Gln) amidotransferase A subunit family amidase